MRRLGARIVLPAVAAMTMIGLSAAPALASTTWTVRPGGTIIARSGRTALRDTRTRTPLTCRSSRTKVKLKRGRRLSGRGLGSITSVTFSRCSGPLSLSFAVKTGHLPWKLNTVSYNRRTGTTSGTITGIHATLSGSGCKATVDGTGATKNNGRVRATYVNRTHKLTILARGGNLHVYRVSNGCLGLIRSGDPTTYSATYTVRPSQKITSP